MKVKGSNLLFLEGPGKSLTRSVDFPGRLNE